MLTWAAAGLLAITAGPALAGGKKAAEEATCGEFGTSLHFEKTPSDAAAKAQKAEKLVFVLHISGHFEDPTLT
jgi:hypothetical protein